MKPGDPLDELLRQAREPKRAAEYWEAFPEKVTARLRREESRRAEAMQPETARGSWLGWGLGLATACLMLGFFLGLWRGREQKVVQAPPLPATQLEQYRKLFGEIATLFPNRVKAIVIEGNNVQLVLAEQATVPNSTPLWVEICQGGRCRDFITFSGQSVQVNGSSYEVLSDAKENVIVVGNKLVWTSTGVAEDEREPVHIRAKSLAVNL
ncbi:MAG: hypothetical protein AB1705_07480 [Verrucomicrobiota bacterium]